MIGMVIGMVICMVVDIAIHTSIVSDLERRCDDTKSFIRVPSSSQSLRSTRLVATMISNFIKTCSISLLYGWGQPSPQILLLVTMCTSSGNNMWNKGGKSYVSPSLPPSCLKNASGDKKTRPGQHLVRNETTLFGHNGKVYSYFHNPQLHAFPKCHKMVQSTMGGSSIQVRTPTPVTWAGVHGEAGGGGQIFCSDFGGNSLRHSEHFECTQLGYTFGYHSPQM